MVAQVVMELLVGQGHVAFLMQHISFLTACGVNFRTLHFWRHPADVGLAMEDTLHFQPIGLAVYAV